MKSVIKKFIDHPLAIPLSSAFFIGCAIIITVLTYGPIMLVELNYQYHKVLENVFHAESLTALILPTLNTEGIGVKYKQFGMQIPTLHLNEPVVFNVDPHNKNTYNEALKKGIAHASGTDLPPYDGLGYYFAHSSHPDVRSQYNAVFYLLGKLKKDNEVYIWYENTKYVYVVKEISITSPQDVSFLDRKYPAPTIVMQTCWPPGTTQKRLLVFAERKQLD
jgi:LPXTG-site transpeptidase (sortase) family protein